MKFFLIYFVSCFHLFNFLKEKRLFAIAKDYSLSSIQIQPKHNFSEYLFYNSSMGSLMIVDQNQAMKNYNDTLFKYSANSKIINYSTNKCLDIQGKLKLTFSECKEDNDGQKWKLSNNKIENFNLKEKCLSIYNKVGIILSDCSNATEFILNDIHKMSFIEIEHSGKSKFLSKDLLLKFEDSLNQLTDKIIDTSKTMNNIDKNYSIIRSKIINLINGNNHSITNVQLKHDYLTNLYKKNEMTNSFHEKAEKKISNFTNNMFFLNKQKNFIFSKKNEKNLIFDLNNKNFTVFSFFNIKDSIYSINGPSNWKNIKGRLVDTSKICTTSTIAGSVLKMKQNLNIKEKTIINITLSIDAEFTKEKKRTSFYEIKFKYLDEINNYYSILFNSREGKVLQSDNIIYSFNYSQSTTNKNNFTIIYDEYDNVEMNINNQTIFAMNLPLNSTLKKNSFLFNIGINSLNYFSINSFKVEEINNIHHYTIKTNKPKRNEDNNIKKEYENKYKDIYSFKTKCFAFEEEALCNYLFNFIQVNHLDISMIGTKEFNNKIYHSCIDKIHSHTTCNEIMIKLMPILSKFEKKQ